MKPYSELKAYPAPQLIHFGNLTLDPKMGKWTIGEQIITLSPPQTAIIKALMLAKGEICSREKLFDAYVAKNNSDRAVDYIIRDIRRKIKKAKLHDPIVTIIAGGYQLWPKGIDQNEIIDNDKGKIVVTILNHTLTLYPSYQVVGIKNDFIQLTPYEMAIMKAMMKSSSKIFSRGELLTAFGANLDIEDRVITDHIKRLRNKLSAFLGFDFIASEYGVGYRLNLNPSASIPRIKRNKINYDKSVP